MNRHSLNVGLAALALAVACGDVTVPGFPDAGGDTAQPDAVQPDPGPAELPQDASSPDAGQDVGDSDPGTADPGTSDPGTADPGLPEAGQDPGVETGPVTCAETPECGLPEWCKKEPGNCDAAGTCAPRPTLCPASEAPVCGCDGVTYENDCLAAMTGTAVAHAGECLTPCSGSEPCPSTDQYCATNVEDCGGVGQCKPRPKACLPGPVDQEVCGCDGITYPSGCDAAMAGVSVASKGACVVSGCQGNLDCPKSQFCVKSVGDCKGMGVCKARPEICPKVYSPVCGCDGTTYDNECFANMSGVSVKAPGPCL